MMNVSPRRDDDSALSADELAVLRGLLDAPADRAYQAAAIALVAGIEPDRVRLLDEGMRREGSGRLGEGTWMGLVADPSTPRAVVALGTSHASGWVREVALERLLKTLVDRDLPWLLRRAGDWVPAIQARAIAALSACATDAWLPAWLSAAPAMMQAAEVRRAPALPAALDDVSALVRRHRQKAAVTNLITHPDRATRRWAAALVLARPVDRDLLFAALVHADTAIRSIAARQLAPAAGDAVDLELLEVALRSGIGRVRQHAFEVMAAHAPDRAELVARAAIFDRAEGMRALARGLRRNAEPGFDAVSVYRAALADTGARRAIALDELATLGDATDVGAALDSHTHPSVRVRRATIGILRRHATADTTAALLELLRDRAPSVARAAANALVRRPGGEITAAAWALLQNPSTGSPGRDAAKMLLVARGKWIGLAALLVVQDKTGLPRWLARFNRSFVAPTPTELADARAALTNATALPPDLRRELDAIVTLGR